MTNPQNQKSLNLTLISRRNERVNRGEIFEKLKSRKPKLRLKLNQIMILK